MTADGGALSCDRSVLKQRLCRAILGLQEAILSDDTETSGSLCQVWLPEKNDDGAVVLRTKGLPFCVAGVGDLLALFRCISCRYCFGTDLNNPSTLGAPGRVMATCEPEMSRNVGKYSDKEVYARASEAVHCRVHACLILPLFMEAACRNAVGVLEVVQTVEDMAFQHMASTLAKVLKRCQLYTCDTAVDQKEMEFSLAAAKSFAALRIGSQPSSPSGSGARSQPQDARMTEADRQQEAVSEQASVAEGGGAAATSRSPPTVGEGGVGNGMQTNDVELYAEVSLRSASAPDARMRARSERHMDAATAKAEEDRSAAAQDAFDPRGSGPLKRRSAASGKGAATQEEAFDDDGEDDIDEDSDDEQQAREPQADRRRRGKGSGNPGKPGKKLKLEDLQSQFGVGLKEAAGRLGICATTLKRACRRHGIQRWPRRQLMKINRAMEKMDASNPAGLPGPAGGGPGAEGQDDRWLTLTQLMPTMRGARSGTTITAEQVAPMLVAPASLGEAAGTTALATAVSQNLHADANTGSPSAMPLQPGSLAATPPAVSASELDPQQSMPVLPPPLPQPMQQLSQPFAAPQLQQSPVLLPPALPHQQQHLLQTRLASVPSSSPGVSMHLPGQAAEGSHHGPEAAQPSYSDLMQKSSDGVSLQGFAAVEASDLASLNADLGEPPDNFMRQGLPHCIPPLSDADLATSAPSSAVAAGHNTAVTATFPSNAQQLPMSSQHQQQLHTLMRQMQQQQSAGAHSMSAVHAAAAAVAAGHSTHSMSQQPLLVGPHVADALGVPDRLPSSPQQHVSDTAQLANSRGDPPPGHSFARSTAPPSQISQQQHGAADHEGARSPRRRGSSTNGTDSDSPMLQSTSDDELGDDVGLIDPDVLEMLLSE